MFVIMLVTLGLNSQTNFQTDLGHITEKRLTETRLTENYFTEMVI
jgi:hypothetical protein